MEARRPTQPTNLSVVEVRRNLNEMRKLWRSHRPSAPFYASAPLPNSTLTGAEFAFLFVQSHHRQRSAGSSSGAADEMTA